ncbi:MAG: PrsW family glutamic-type intramembrane protease, partial [Chloroflexota bacterium]
MNENEPSPITKMPTDWLSIAQFVGNLLAMLFLFGGAATLFITGLFQYFSAKQDVQIAAASLNIITANILVGIVMILSAGFALLNISSKRYTVPPIWKKILKLLHPKYWILSLPLILWIGYFLAREDILPWYFPPILNQFVAIISAAWLIWLGTRGLKKGSQQRIWGTLSSGLIAAPALIMVIEIAGAVLVAIVIVIFIFKGDPNLEVINYWATRLTVLSEQEMLAQLQEQINRPIVLWGAVGYLGIFVPIVEEFFKPLAVWLLARKKLTSQEGFTVGVISGAGYAMFENLYAS